MLHSTQIMPFSAITAKVLQKNEKGGMVLIIARQQ